MKDSDDSPKPDDRPLTSAPGIALPDWLRDYQGPTPAPSIPEPVAEPASPNARIGPIPADGLAAAIPDWMTKPASKQGGHIDTSSAPRIDFGNLIESSDLPTWIRRIGDPSTVETEIEPHVAEVTSASPDQQLTLSTPKNEATPWVHRDDINSTSSPPTQNPELEPERRTRSPLAVLLIVGLLVAVVTAAILLS